MITFKSVIIAFLSASSLWYLFSYHKSTCSTQSNPSVVCLTTGTCSSASSGTFENATDGTFHSATAGTFVSATGGTFNPLLSVTHEPGRELEHVVIKTHSLYVHGLMKTKPVHSSFEEICPYSSQDGYGLVSYDVEPNREFIGRILSFGANIEVIEPFALRKEVAINAECLAQVYGITSTAKLNDSESE